MKKAKLGVLASVFVLAGCGSEIPFERGPNIDDDLATPPDQVTDISFSADVVPILQSCTGCHTSGTGGWTYSGGAGSHGQVLSVINTTSPANSLLLVKATGAGGHGGGSLFSASSDEYQAILAWIQEGAMNN